MAAETDSGSLISERVAGGILPKVLTTFDMVAIFVAIVLFITNAAVIQSAGPSAFGWWIIGFVVFLVPCAIATGQLGAMFPGEGSIYVASLVGIVATLSGSWTPLISNSAGSFSVFGAVISYGTWFWWVAGITVISLGVAVLLYLIGRRTSAGAAPVTAGAAAAGATGTDG